MEKGYTWAMFGATIAVMLIATTTLFLKLTPGTIFQDFELGNGTPGAYYQDIWGSNPVFEHTIVYNGTRSLKINAENWGGIVKINAASPSGYFDMSGARAFFIWIYDTQENTSIELRLIDENGEMSGYHWSSTSSKRNQWTKMTWDLSLYSDASNLDWRRIASIDLLVRKSGIYYFDVAEFLKI